MHKVIVLASLEPVESWHSVIPSASLHCVSPVVSAYLPMAQLSHGGLVPNGRFVPVFALNLPTSHGVQLP